MKKLFSFFSRKMQELLPDDWSSKMAAQVYYTKQTTMQNFGDNLT